MNAIVSQVSRDEGRAAASAFLLSSSRALEYALAAITNAAYNFGRRDWAGAVCLRKQSQQKKNTDLLVLYRN